jgi:amino acid transporter
MTYLWVFLYLLAVAGLDWLVYKRLHERWRRRERARIVAGVLVATVPALVMALAGLLDLLTWIVIFSGFGSAGAITLYLDIQIETDQAAEKRGGFHDA